MRGGRITPLETLTFSSVLYALDHPDRGDSIIPSVLAAVPQLSPRACMAVLKALSLNRRQVVEGGVPWPNGLAWAGLETSLSDRVHEHGA